MPSWPRAGLGLPQLGAIMVGSFLSRSKPTLLCCSVPLGLGPADPVALPSLRVGWVLRRRQWWENGWQQEKRLPFF